MTQALKHTPGPWWISKRRKYRVQISGANWSNFAKVFVRMHGDPEDLLEGLANARLIAAAPELLEACEAQRQAIDRLMTLCIAHIPGFIPSKSGQPWKAVVAGNVAIAKATGGAA